MAGLGRKTFSPGDVLTWSDVQGYLMDQSVMVFSGTAARASAIPSPSAGMVAYSTATQLQVYNGSAWVDASLGYGVASGTAAASTAITVAGTAYTLLTFTADSTLSVTKAGLFDVLVVGAGGAGGQVSSALYPTGGGGGGQALQTTIYASANQTVTIGAGGVATYGANNQVAMTGAGSSIGALAIAAGGGGGGGTDATYASSGRAGANGGGGNGSNVSGSSSLAGVSNASGFAGGAGVGANSQGAGGGGGVSAVGANGSGTTGGAGGAGLQLSTFTGSTITTFVGAGGGGAGTVGGAAGSTGAGAGGSATTGGNATANTGSGGGGSAGTTLNGGTGGSGVVYIRFKV